jgi:hypothetical protein
MERQVLLFNVHIAMVPDEASKVEEMSVVQQAVRHGMPKVPNPRHRRLLRPRRERPSGSRATNKPNELPPSHPYLPNPLYG